MAINPNDKVFVVNENINTQYGGVDPTGEFVAVSELGGSSYKVYTALLTQVGTNAPEAIILEDTIGNISFAYDGIGFYRIVNSQLFDLNKTAMFLGPRGDNGSFEKTLYGPGYWGITTYNNLGVLTNGDYGSLILAQTPIEIRIYN